jgi:hypothetical protein
MMSSTLVSSTPIMLLRGSVATLQGVPTATGTGALAVPHLHVPVIRSSQPGKVIVRRQSHQHPADDALAHEISPAVTGRPDGPFARSSYRE